MVVSPLVDGFELSAGKEVSPEVPTALVYVTDSPMMNIFSGLPKIDIAIRPLAFRAAVKFEAARKMFLLVPAEPVIARPVRFDKVVQHEAICGCCDA